MCRLLGWSGRRLPLAELVTDPAHSLCAQSRRSREAKVLGHADGSGLAWYERGGRPHRYRDRRPAWRDRRLARICDVHASTLMLAHVRAATCGHAGVVNCHPFVDGRHAFAHNGQIGDIERIRPRLLARLDRAGRRALAGDTDSELMFRLLLHHGLAIAPEAAWAAVLDEIARAQRAAGVRVHLRLCCLHSDGHSLFAIRYGSDGLAPKLYRSTSFVDGGVTLASEPLDERRHGWTPLAADRLWRLRPRAACAGRRRLPG